MKSVGSRLKLLQIDFVSSDEIAARRSFEVELAFEDFVQKAGHLVGMFDQSEGIHAVPGANICEATDDEQEQCSQAKAQANRFSDGPIHSEHLRRLTTTSGTAHPATPTIAANDY